MLVNDTSVFARLARSVAGPLARPGPPRDDSGRAAEPATAGSYVAGAWCPAAADDLCLRHWTVRMLVTVAVVRVALARPSSAVPPPRRRRHTGAWRRCEADRRSDTRMCGIRGSRVNRRLNRRRLTPVRMAAFMEHERTGGVTPVRVAARVRDGGGVADLVRKRRGTDADHCCGDQYECRHNSACEWNRPATEALGSDCVLVRNHLCLLRSRTTPRSC